MSLSVASILAEAALRHPGRTAVVFGTERLAYGDLWEQARRYGAQFKRMGVAPGDRVAILLLNTPDFPRAYSLGALAVGAVVVPVHALLTPSEIAFILRDSGAKLLVCSPALATNGKPGAEAAGVPYVEAVLPGDTPISALLARNESDDAVILYTSGTTGTPKGAVLTNNNIVLNATVCAYDLFGATYDDVFLGVVAALSRVWGRPA